MGEGGIACIFLFCFCKASSCNYRWKNKKEKAKSKEGKGMKFSRDRASVVRSSSHKRIIVTINSRR